MTLQEFDEYMILILSLWFIPKGILFFATWWISKKLTPIELRSALGDAYRGIFLSLGWFSIILAGVFFLRWADDRPMIQTGPWVLGVILRVALLVVMIFVSIQEIRAFRELLARYHAGLHLQRDPDYVLESELDQCLTELSHTDLHKDA